MRTLSILILSSMILEADTFSHALSSQGFTGLINTPNAQVIKEGNAVFQFNNQFDNHLRGYNNNKKYTFEENYIFGIGILPYFEFAGRLVEARGYARDLAGNFKLQIPYKSRYLPNIALGAQDFGGAANFYDNTYIVVDKEFGFMRASLGYGKSGDNINREHGKNKNLGKRMDGIFGGVEAKVTDYFSLLVEHDGKENHAGLRVSVPQNILSSVKLEATLAQNLTENQTHIAFNLTVPLFAKNTLEIPYDDYHEKKIIEGAYPMKLNEQLLKTDKKSMNPLFAIQNRLVTFGFENVQVGNYNNSIYVKFENSIFDHTDLDALGYVIGTISANYPENKHYIVTLLKNNLQTMTVSGESEKFKEYLKHPTPMNAKRLKNNLAFSRTFDEKNVAFISSKKNSSFFKPRVELSPGLLTTVGTEIGVFDYLTTLRTNVYMPVYDGVVVSAMYETPLMHSKNFNKDAVYGRRNSERLTSHLVNTMVHQTTHYESLFNTLSVGQFQRDYYGILNQTNFTDDSGEHGINLKIGSFKSRTPYQNRDKEFYLGSYRYFYQPLNLFTEVTYGQYWNEDRGTTLEFKRFFDQTSLSLYFKDVGYRYAGIRVTLPLTTRKGYNSKYFQIKGKKDFTYGIRTTLQEQSGGNIQRPNGGIIPKSDFELANTYLDRDRLNQEYIKGNIERMREAYIHALP